MRLVYRRPDRVEFREPPVGGRLVPNAAPDPLLGVQGGLVPREIVKAQARVSVEERVHGLPLVPPRAIDIQPDCVPVQPSVEMPECLEEARPVAPGHLDHATPAEEGRHPAAEVKPSVVLARRGEPEALAPLRPPAAEAGMEREARLIRERDGLGRSQAAEFFLAGVGTPARRYSAPGGSCSWPASTGSPVGGARVGLGAP